MGTIVISQNVTLDGVMDDPTGEGGSARGGWFVDGMGADREQWAAVEFAEARQAAALLLGRRTDAYFGSRWNDLPGEWADRLRELPKYVVSSTIEQTVWHNGTVLRGDVVEEVTLLKKRIEGEIVVYGSRRLVHTLFEHDLVDELRLFVFPVVAGTGGRLFASTPAALRRLDVRSVGENLVHQRFAVAR